MIRSPKILLVDDEHKLLNSMAQRVSLLGFDPVECGSGMEAIEAVKSQDFHMAIVDLKMPEMDGLVTITKLKEFSPELRTVLLTGFGNAKTQQATEALGSLYYEKDNTGDLWDLIKRNGPSNNDAPRHSRPGAGMPEKPAQKQENHPEIIGQTPAMLRLRKNIRRLAELDCTVLIYGETGTGKELAARTIHRLSNRSQQKFIAFDSGCFSEDFHFAELISTFEKVQKTDTESAKNGSSEFTGTIFLDHIENMPRKIQAEMLRTLQPKPPVNGGGTKYSLPDIRFIVATHIDLEEKVKKNKFDEDLFHKIKAIELAIPPLRERLDDIRLFCREFAAEANVAQNKEVSRISDDVYKAFETYSFPGNVRELKQTIEQAVMRTESRVIEHRHLPQRFSETQVTDSVQYGLSNFPTIDEMESVHILKALELTKGNRTQAAKLLGISRAALWRKLRLMNV